MIPTNDGLACVFAGATPSRIGRGGLDGIQRASRRGVARRSPSALAAAEPPAALRTFAGRPGYIRRSWGPGWALVGDAGYWKDPLSAHGLTDALRDAELLARAVVAVVADGAAERDALAGYQARATGSRPTCSTSST